MLSFLLRSRVSKRRSHSTSARRSPRRLSHESLESRKLLAASIFNLGLANSGFVPGAAFDSTEMDGNLLAIKVGESSQNVDLNGDGDLADSVMHVYNTDTAVTTNLGLDSSGFQTFQVNGDLLAFKVREANQGIDLNGDADLIDSVMHVYDLSTGITTNLGLDSSSFSNFLLRGDHLAFTVDESAQGATDLNGDGDANDRVMHVYDADTGLTTNLELAHFSGLQLAGDTLAFPVNESDQGGTDLNGDGDTMDNVLYTYRFDTGVSSNLMFAIPAGGFRLNGDLLAIAVDEAAQGGTDLNGDFDPADRAVHVHDPVTGTTTNLGLDAVIMAANDDLLAFIVRESNQGNTDLNGDGDASDGVVHFYDGGTGVTSNLGLASQNSIQMQDSLLIVQVNELRQGNTDLNGDGDTSDNVTHVYQVDTGATNNLQLAAEFSLRIDGNVLAISVVESQQNADLNGDGDQTDRVAHVHDATGGTTTNLELAVDGFQFSELAGGVLAFRVAESAQNNTDLNADGDATDVALHVYDTASAQTSNLEIAVASENLHLVNDILAFSVSEADQAGTDLNGDGNAIDFVSHVADLSPELDPSETIPELIDAVEDLNDTGVLSNGEANPVENHLRQAFKNLSKGKTAQAIAKLQQARDELQDLIDDGDLDAATGDPLIATIDQLIDQLLGS